MQSFKTEEIPAGIFRKEDQSSLKENSVSRVSHKEKKVLHNQNTKYIYINKFN